MVDVPVNTQREPVAYLARKFAINYNLPKLSEISGTGPGSPRIPTLSSVSSLALAAFALLRLRTAQLAATDDAPGAWDAEVTDAEALADKALAAVSASHDGYFPTAQRVFNKLQVYGDNHNSGSIPGKGSLPADWATNRGSLPVAAAFTGSANKGAAIDINLMSGVTNAETTETLVISEVGGKTWGVGNKVTINGVEFTMAANWHLTAPAQTAGVVFAFTAKIDDGVSAGITRNYTFTVANRVPTGSAITTTVVNNTAINKDFKTLGAWADPDAADVAGLKLVEFNGTPVPAAGADVQVSGKTFHVTQAGVVTAPAQTTPATWTGTFKVRDADAKDPKTSAAINWSIQNLPA